MKKKENTIKRLRVNRNLKKYIYVLEKEKRGKTQKEGDKKQEKEKI